MKSIAILTFVNADNYGALLQCYALQTYIEKNGFKCDVINYYPKYLKDKYEPYIGLYSTYSYYKRCNIKYVALRAIKAWFGNLSYLKRKKYHNSFANFRKNFIHLTKLCKSYSDVYDISKKYDAIVVGSDQVWNKRITGGKFDDVFFLKNINTTCNFSYAASAGSDIAKENIKEFIELLKNLDYISVREPSLCCQINKFLEVNRAFNTLDPVFLISKDEWTDIIPKLKKEKPYIFVYNVSSNDTLKYYEFVKSLASKKSMEIYEIGRKQQIKNSRFFGNASPEVFLCLLQNADLVFSTSFHATALSIIFEKQFLVYKPNNASRITGLLDNLLLSNRIVDANSDVISIFESNVINYDEVFEMLETRKEKSIDYLSRILDIIKFENK